MWLACGGGGEVVVVWLIMHQLMGKYKVGLYKEAHMALQCSAFAFV